MMTSPNHNTPKLRGHVVVTILALLLTASIVVIKAPGVLARPDGRLSAAKHATVSQQIENAAQRPAPKVPITNT